MKVGFPAYILLKIESGEVFRSPSLLGCGKARRIEMMSNTFAFVAKLESVGVEVVGKELLNV